MQGSRTAACLLFWKQTSAGTTLQICLHSVCVYEHQETLRLTGKLHHLKLSSCVRNLFKEGFVHYMLLYVFLLVCSLFSIAVQFFFTAGYMLSNILYFISSFLYLYDNSNSVKMKQATLRGKSFKTYMFIST